MCYIHRKEQDVHATFQEELNKCLAPLRNMLVGIKKKISCRVESEFTRCLWIILSSEDFLKCFYSLQLFFLVRCTEF